MSYNELDLAYIAGLVDGEGCITAFRRKDSRSTRVSFSIAMCSRELLEWASAVFGGRVHEKNQSINKFHNWDQCYVWIASDKAALEILKIIAPYLKLKKTQAELAIQLAELKAAGRPHYPADYPKQLEIVDNIQALNKKGRL